MQAHKLLLFVIILSLSGKLCANPKPYVTNVTRDVYQAANKNWAAAQDERGVMYFGNDIGLLESDGMDWRLHRLPNAGILRSIAVESHQRIYTGGFEELGRWDRDVSGTLRYTSFTHLLKDRTLQNENIWKVWIDGERVYFQSFSCIYVYHNEAIETIASPNGFLFLLKVRDEFWVQEMMGALYQFNNGKLAKAEGSDFLKGKIARVILPYGDNRLLVGVSSGEVYIYDGQNFTLWNGKLSAQLKGQELNNGLYSAKRNTYYLGTQLEGVYEVDTNGEIINHFSTVNTLQNNTVLSLFEDNLSNVWVAMDRGLAYIRYTEGLSYYKANERDAGAVYDAACWQGNLLIGTNQGVYYAPLENLNEQDFFSSLKLIDGTQGQVWTFAEVDGRLLCGQNNSLLEITPAMEARDVYNLNTGVFRIVETRINGVELLLVVTYRNLVVIEKATGKPYEIKQIEDPVINVEVDHLENIWVETVSHGVYKCKYDTERHELRYFTYYGQETDPALPLKLKLFRSGGRILFLGDNTFWTYDENADRLTPNNHLNNCFESVADLKRIVHAGYEQSWAITGSAVYRFFYDGYLARITESYNISTDNLSLINAYENVSIMNDSISMICLDAGFILHNSWREKNSSLTVPAPHLESVQISGTKGNPEYLVPANDFDVPYNFNDVSFHFTVGNAFALGLSVQYRLSGVDNDWNQPVKSNVAIYDRLPEGQYTFQIRTADGLGHFSEPVALSFRVLPPWYQTIWAYILYFLAVLGVMYLAWIMVLRRYRNIHLQKIRAREAQHLRQMNEKLMNEIEEKNAELFTQTSFIIQKNELILKLKGIVDDFNERNTNRSLAPLYQKMNTLLSNNMNTEDDWKMFLIKFEQKHQSFFKRLKILHPQLTNNDLRLCACLKLNLDTKDIASLMNLSVRAVENNRYRLRKKLDLSSSQNLNEYFMEMD